MQRPVRIRGLPFTNKEKDMTTKIEWADMTINPVVGCSHCSPGCDNCYAERFAARLAKNPNPKISGKYAGVVDENGKWTGKMSRRYFIDAAFDSLPKAPKRVFVGSMCDIFHENMNYPAFLHFIKKLSTFPQHTFILLTKRPQRMNKFISLTRETNTDCGLWPLPNLWLGVTVCNQAEADEKIPVLLQTPAAVRFVSVEPCLGPVDLGHLSWTDIIGSTAEKNALTGKTWIQGNCGESSQTLQGNRLGWVICGGETGPGARPMHPDWVRSLRDQCQGARVPFFFKSWGEWAPNCLCGAKSPHPIIQRPTPGHVGCMFKCGKRRAGRLIDGREWNEVPEAC